MATNLSHLATGSLTHGSMSGSNTVSQPASFQPPGSDSEAVTAADVRPQANPVPPVSEANVAGPGDKGGILHGDGADPGASHYWTMASDAATGDGNSRSTTARQPGDHTDI